MADSLLTLMNESSSRFKLKSHDQEMSVGFEIESFRDVANPRSAGLSGTADEKSNNNGREMHITWEDLSVTVLNGTNGSKPILRALTGFARPAELLAIMGPSGCGKSTLLDALAGRLSSNMSKTGDILINGRKQALAYGTSAYVLQDEALISTLTVKEAVHYSAQLQLPSSMSKAEKRERADATIREMGLQGAANTRIGGLWGGNKGLSRGQKRRLSICLEILSHPTLLFLDEPTSGLDSAASYYVMSRIARLKEGDGVGRTIVASIHQPSSEVFQLFDSLCLLSCGKTVYFGPTSAVNEFFAMNGFPCATHMNPSDHFLKTINKDFETDEVEGQPPIGGAKAAEEAIKTLSTSYLSSTYYHQVQRQVANICKGAEGRHGVQTIKERNKASVLTHCLVLTKRSTLNMHRDVGYYWLRIAFQTVLALGIGLIFNHVGFSYGSIQGRTYLIMFVASFLNFMAVGGFPSFVEDVKVYLRERLNGHYGATAFVVANTISSLPFILLLAIIPGPIMYYLPGLHGGPVHILYFVLLLFSCMILVESIMMVIACLVPNFLMGIISGAGIIGLMVLAAGIIRFRDDLPAPFWRYPLYYIAFHNYAYQGLAKNEFEGLKFPDRPGGTVQSTIDGDTILRDILHVDMGHSKWVDLGILLAMVPAYRLMFFAIIKINEVVRPKLVALLAAKPKKAVQIGEENHAASADLELGNS